MSASPKHSMHDLEKGRHSSPHTSGFGFPQRRRKSIITVLIIIALGLYIFASEQSDSTLSPRPWKWVKDSMRPVSEQVQDATVSFPEKSALKGSDGSIAQGQNDQPFEPTPALIAYASEMKTPLPTSRPHDPSEMDGPSQIDQVLLFLTAMKDEAYRVPEQQAQRTKELQPSTTSDFLKTLVKIKAKSDDQILYRDSQSSWRQKHRAQSPITVFSKSYCPYSKRAKALLTDLGVQFDLYEVDLRDDARSLQAGLKEISNHATFPTIFVRDEVIGGYDDLARLQRIGVLKGILEGAGVRYTEASAHV